MVVTAQGAWIVQALLDALQLALHPHQAGLASAADTQDSAREALNREPAAGTTANWHQYKAVGPSTLSPSTHSLYGSRILGL